MNVCLAGEKIRASDVLFHSLPLFFSVTVSSGFGFQVILVRIRPGLSAKKYFSICSRFVSFSELGDFACKGLIFNDFCCVQRTKKKNGKAVLTGIFGTIVTKNNQGQVLRRYSAGVFLSSRTAEQLMDLSKWTSRPCSSHGLPSTRVQRHGWKTHHFFKPAAGVSLGLGV